MNLFGSVSRVAKNLHYAKFKQNKFKHLKNIIFRKNYTFFNVHKYLAHNYKRKINNFIGDFFFRKKVFKCFSVHFGSGFVSSLYVCNVYSTSALMN